MTDPTDEDPYREPADHGTDPPQTLGDELRRAVEDATYRFDGEPFERTRRVQNWLTAVEDRCREAAAGGKTTCGEWATPDDMTADYAASVRFEDAVLAWARRSKVHVTIVRMVGKPSMLTVRWDAPEIPPASAEEERTHAIVEPPATHAWIAIGWSAVVLAAVVAFAVWMCR